MEKDFIGDLILLRGVPGSGKSTLGEVILNCPQSTTNTVLSADDLFTDSSGNYNFDSSRIKEAHNLCQQKCAEKMKLGLYKIVVANTFTQEWEMSPYYEMAERYKYRVHSIIVENRHNSVNVHNVPEEKLTQMKDRFEVSL
jgi:predicted kinase